MSNLKKSLTSSILELWRLLEKKRKVEFWIVLILMIVSSIVEIASIGLVVPFLAILTEPEAAFNHQYMQPFVKQFAITAPDQIVLPLALVFIFSVLMSSLIRTLLLFLSTRLSFVAGSNLLI